VECMNLIPAPRREARARRRHLRALGTVVGAYAAVVLAGYAVCFALSDDGAEAVARQMTRTQGEVSEHRREVRRLGAQIATVRRELAATRSVAQHPDWSLLLAVLAETLSDELVLERCALEPIEPPPGRARDAPDPNSPDVMTARLRRSYRLHVTGVAKAQTAVSRFVLRLEKIRLFDNVRLVQTARRTFLGGRAVSFELECTLDGKGAAKP